MNINLNVHIEFNPIGKDTSYFIEVVGYAFDKRMVHAFFLSTLVNMSQLIEKAVINKVKRDIIKLGNLTHHE